MRRSDATWMRGGRIDICGLVFRRVFCIYCIGVKGIFWGLSCSISPIIGSQCVMDFVILTCWVKVFCLNIACADGQSTLSNCSSDFFCFFLIYSLRIRPCRSLSICAKKIPVFMTPLDSKYSFMDVCGFILLFDCVVSS